MTITDVAVGGKVTAAKQNEIIATANAVGLVAVVPTVAGVGVTVDAAGLVTFTTATAVNVNGCFTSTFRNYRVIANVTARSTNSFSTLKLRASGTDLSTGYDLVRTIYAASVSNAQLANNGDMPLGSDNFPKQNYEIEMRVPQLSVQTGYNTRATEIQAAAVPTVVTADGSTRSTSAYDGFSVLANAGNMTGTLKVYGYN